MKITVTRSGGFAGLTQRHTLDLATLTPPQRVQLEHVFSASKLSNLSLAKPLPSQRGQADRFAYRINCEETPGAFDVVVTESDLTDELRDGMALFSKLAGVVGAKES